MRRLIAKLRRLLCTHRFDFLERLPEVNGRAAIAYQCEFCGLVRTFKDARIIR